MVVDHSAIHRDPPRCQRGLLFFVDPKAAQHARQYLDEQKPMPGDPITILSPSAALALTWKALKSEAINQRFSLQTAAELAGDNLSGGSKEGIAKALDIGGGHGSGGMCLR